MKTRRAVKKRFKVTATGRLMHKAVGMGHLLSKKTRRRKRRLSQEGEVTGGYKRQMLRNLPYGAG